MLIHSPECRTKSLSVAPARPEQGQRFFRPDVDRGREMELIENGRNTLGWLVGVGE